MNIIFSLQANCFEIIAPKEGQVFDVFQRARECDFFYSRFPEAAVSNFLQPALFCAHDALQFRTLAKSFCPDLPHTRRNINALDIASPKPVVSDLLSSFWNYDPL